MPDIAKPMAPIATPHPGITLQSWLERNSITVEQLSGLAGFDLAKAEALIAGKIGLTREMAVTLSGLFGTSSNYWMRLQAAYDALTADPAAATPAAAEPVPGAVGYTFGLDEAGSTTRKWAIVVAMVFGGVVLFYVLGWLTKMVLITVAVLGAGVALVMLLRKMNPASAGK